MLDMTVCDGWGVCREQEKLFSFIPDFVTVLNYVNWKVYSSMQRSPRITLLSAVRLFDGCFPQFVLGGVGVLSCGYKTAKRRQTIVATRRG
jgi:hypothetical protein